MGCYQTDKIVTEIISNFIIFITPNQLMGNAVIYLLLSLQDTIMALKALVEFAKMGYKQSFVQHEVRSDAYCHEPTPPSLALTEPTGSTYKNSV